MVTAREPYMRTQAVYAKHARLKDDISNVFNFQQRLLFAHINNRRCNSGTQISAVTWETIHEHIVANVFCSKKSSSVLLFQEQQASLKWCLSSRHSTACCDCKKNIYENTGSGCKMSERWKETYQMSLTFNSACCLHITATTDVIVIYIYIIYM